MTQHNVKITSYLFLIEKYCGKADFHGYEFIFSNKRYQKYHEFKEEVANKTIIKLVEKYLKEAR